MFKYDNQTLANIEKSISSERLSTYLKETNLQKELAFALYLQNSSISASFFMPLQNLEVTLRNAIHKELTKFYKTSDWYESISLNAVGKNMLKKAKSNTKRLHKTITPSHIVAELSFGFWLMLLSSHYHQSLWIPVLHKAFPHAQKKRAVILNVLDNLRKFRNRIAHHEPIFKRHLEKDYENIITAINWICPDTAKWTHAHSNVYCTIKKET